jgi:predicted NBD/HSP70 family sugar kinase
MSEPTARSPRLLRRINSSAVLRFALGTGDFTAGQAMAASGLTRATVLGVCGDLVSAGWLEEIADSRAAGLSSRGRPARRYRVPEDAGYVVGVDAGEHRLHVLVADLRGRVLASVHEELIADDGELGPAVLDAEARVRAIRRAITGTLENAGVDAADVLLNVVGVPAPVDAGGRTPAGDGRFWPRMNPDLDTRLDGRVLIENDANLAALAEHSRDPADDVATLVTGERLGAGLIVDGHLLRGYRGGAGELRLLELTLRDDPAAGAGATDGLGALARRWARHELETTTAPSTLRGTALEEIGAPDVFAAALAGDALAERVIERLGARLAHVAVVLESVLDVEKIVIAGGIASAVEPVLAAARAVLESEASPPIPELVASTLGREVIALGAIELALTRVREEPLAFSPRTSRAGG